MRAYWITFTDGSKGCCEGESVYDAKGIAEKISGKSVAPRPEIESPAAWKEDHWQIETLPYPARPIIWQFDHPVHGRCPVFCYKPGQCKGRTSCPQNRSCTE